MAVKRTEDHGGSLADTHPKAEDIRMTEECCYSAKSGLTGSGLQVSGTSVKQTVFITEEMVLRREHSELSR
ncbi:MAG TPA: hypothetical protein DCZ91_01655 [Lachnospiraceae bacterium]|nr:hypothetical protein [Lachnospiraceae bacterium]